MTVLGTHVLSAATMSAMSVEKRVLTDFLQLYKEFPCLWDNRQVLYSNKEARDQAYEVLLEKYRRVQEDATVVDVKKKIENMRCAYRREHKKVLISRLRGDVEEYAPTLWYYELMLFLNDVSEFGQLEVTPREIVKESFKIEYDGVSLPKYKRKKVSSVPTIYLPEHDSDDDNDDEHDTLLQSNHDMENSHTSLLVNNAVSEAEAFGTTVGLQLRDVDPMQRVIAEKLISDVIFNARLNKLSVNSTFAVVGRSKLDDSF